MGFFGENIYSLCLILKKFAKKNNKTHELKNYYIMKSSNTK
jgi:hypothetical protein